MDGQCALRTSNDTRKRFENDGEAHRSNAERHWQPGNRSRGVAFGPHAWSKMLRWCDDGMHWMDMGEGGLRLRFHPLQMGEMAHRRLAFSWPACTGCLPLSESIEISSLHQLAGLKRPRISRRWFPLWIIFLAQRGAERSIGKPEVESHYLMGCTQQQDS